MDDVQDTSGVQYKERSISVPFVATLRLNSSFFLTEIGSRILHAVASFLYSP